MDQTLIIAKTLNFVKTVLINAEGGHDYWHAYRVWRLAKYISETEDVDLFVVELGALLHDIADVKFNNGDETIGPQKAREFLNTLGVAEVVITQVENVIKNISFGGGNEISQFQSKELAVVQDADRLDALGAIGIARTFNYGGYKNRPLYDPAIKPNLQMSKVDYRNSDAPTINHFYEKLLLLKDKMNTKTGKKLAQQRHEFMQYFLDEFYREWSGGL